MEPRELSIKVKIAEREYPMRIDASEEQRLRSAGKLVNEKLKSYREIFGIDDKQDLLAMVAFEIMVEKIKDEEQEGDTSQHLIDKVDRLQTLIQQALSI